MMVLQIAISILNGRTIEQEIEESPSDYRQMRVVCISQPSPQSTMASLARLSSGAQYLRSRSGSTITDIDDSGT